MMKHASLVLGSAIAALLLVAPPAHAQFGGGLGGNQIGPGAKGAPVKALPTPPDALPGAKVDPNLVIPSEHGFADLQPTDALFDAINRGDIADARDAIARGADLNGKNVLGMSPLATSVDLGRNNITFLLLSLRGLDQPDREKRPVRTGSAGAPPSAKPPPARREAAAKPRARLTPAAAVRSGEPSPPLFAGGGEPVPQAGFLGFGTVQR